MFDNSNALVSLYHPAGAKVSIPLSLAEAINTTQAAILVSSVDALISSGFTVNLPGLLDGENFEQIGFAVRREILNQDDESVTPVLDVYPANGNFRMLGLYLNTQDDIKNFEAATGLKVNAMPLYDGSPIERGKNPRLDKFVVTTKSPAKIVWKLNPKWEGTDDKKHSKRLFVRWDGLRPANVESEEQPGIQPSKMTLEEAKRVKTPGGFEIGSLDHGKLIILKASKASNMTEEMREAASIILKSQEPA